MRSHVWMAVGLVAALTRSPLLLALTQWLRPLGTLFLNLLSMVVIPLVGTALFAGVAGLGDLRRVGRLGMRTLGFFWGTTLAAIVIGFAVAALCLPFAAITLKQQAALRLAASADSGFVRHAAEQIPTGARFIVELIPANPVRAAVDGNLLPVIVFTTIFAVAAAALPDDKRRTLTDLADVATQALIRIVHWVLLVAPLGILALVAGAVAQHGWALVKTMAVFVLAVIAGLAVFIAVVLLPAVVLVARLGAGRFLRAIRSGSALFQAVAVLFVAQLYGAGLGLGDMFQAGAAVFLASLTVASVPSASIVSLAPAFTATGLPLSGLTLLLGLDRIPDMFRTMTNVMGTLAGSAVVAAVEGEKLE